MGVARRDGSDVYLASFLSVPASQCAHRTKRELQEKDACSSEGLQCGEGRGSPQDEQIEVRADEASRPDRKRDCKHGP